MDPTAPVPIERLLEHRDWVRALARALVGDQSRADDVAQDAWLAALRHPPRHADGLKSWLGRLVRHRASNARRAATRRTAHETAPPGSRPTVDPADAVAQIEELERVVRAVLALAEPYRTAVVLRFYEDLDAHEIAARTGAPVETVRTRLKRALTQLRGRLDADHGGDGRAWSAALVPLAGHPLVAAKAAGTLGGVAVTTKTKASLAFAALALLALTAWFVVDGGSRGSSSSASSLVAVGTAGTRAPQGREKSTGASKEKTATAPAALPGGTGTIVGAVRFADGGKPSAGRKVVLETSGAAPADTVTGEDGRFRFDRLAAGRAWRVSVAAEGFARIAVPDIRLGRDEVRDLGVLRLDAPVVVEVSVRDWSDRPIAKAAVEVHAADPRGMSYDQWTTSDPVRHVPEPVASATTAADGRATIDLPPGRWFVSARAAGFAMSWRENWEIARGSQRQELTLRLDRGFSVSGRVTGRDGRPRGGVLVWAANENAYAGGKAFPSATTDDDGRFAIDGVAAGVVKFLVGAGGGAPGEAARIRVPAAAPVDLVLDGNVVEGRVTSAPDGTPLAGARVRAAVSAKSRTFWTVEAITGDDGAYRLDTVCNASVNTFRVEAVGFVAFTENPWEKSGFWFKDGRAARDFTLDRGAALSGVVTTPSGPAIGARVVANWGATAGGLVSLTGFTDAAGRFAFPGVQPGPVVVQAFADDAFQTGLDPNWMGELMWHKRPKCAVDLPAAGLPDVTIALVAGRTVSGRVESPDGAPAAGATVQSSWDSATTATDGSFRLVTAPVEGRSWVAASKGQTSAPSQEIAGEGDVKDIVLRLAASVHVTGTVTAAGGAAPDGASVQVVFAPAKPMYDQREWQAARVPVVEGHFDAEVAAQFPEGKFRVRASAPGFSPAESPPFVIEAGRAPDPTSLVLGPSRALEGRIVSAADESVSVAGVRLSILPSTWQPKPNDFDPRPVGAVTDARGAFSLPDMTDGEFKIDLACDGFVHEVVPVRVPAEGLVLRMTPALEIAGVVRLADGSPLSKVNVMLRRENDQRPDNWWTTQSADDGSYRLDGLPPGTYVVSASQRWQGGESLRPWERTGVPAGTKALAIEMEPAGEVSGRVLDADGRPIANGSVGAYSETGDRYTPSDRTKEDGTFTVRGLGRGSYALLVRPADSPRMREVAEGGRSLSTRVTGVAPGTKGLEVRLPDGAVIRGTLVDATGAPIVREWVRTELLPGQTVDPWLNNAYPGVGAQTDAEGAFAITGLVPGRYRIVLVANAMMDAKVRPLRGGGDVASGAVGVRLVAGGTAPISGSVVDADGKPLADVGVIATPVGGGPGVWARTDAGGAFSIADASDVVRYVVRAQAKGLPPEDVGDVAAGTSGLRFRLAPGLEASGRVLKKDGTPFAKAYVALVLEGSDYKVSVPTDENGAFTAKALKPGTYRVEEILQSIRYGERSTPRACGTIEAGAKDVELRMTE